MADITNHLNTIINAIHGEDVRQAIHDGIEACYTDDRPGGADLKARQQINSILANMIGSNTYEQVLWEGELNIGGDTSASYVDLSSYPSQFPYVLVYFKTINTGAPEIRMFKGSDFEDAEYPVVITSPFLESDGTRATIREMHIKRREGGTNIQYQLYYTYSWILDSQSVTDNDHDVGRRRVINSVDSETQSLILTKITGFNPINEAATEIEQQLQVLMEFRENIIAGEKETLADITAVNSTASGTTPFEIELGTSFTGDEYTLVKISTTTQNTQMWHVYAGTGTDMTLLGMISSTGTSGEFSTSRVTGNITKIAVVNAVVGATYHVVVEKTSESYNNKLVTQDYLTEKTGNLNNLQTSAKTNLVAAVNEVNNKANDIIPLTSEQGQIRFEFPNEEVIVYNQEYIDSEVNDIRYTTSTQIGNLTELTTTNKSNLVSAINEVKESAGMNAQAAQALLDLFEHVRYEDDQALVYFNRLKSALGL